MGRDDTFCLLLTQCNTTAIVQYLKRLQLNLRDIVLMECVGDLVCLGVCLGGVSGLGVYIERGKVLCSLVYDQIVL